MNYYPLYWIRSSNFGDALNDYLYRFITGRDPVFSDKSPKIVAAGSILHCVNPYDIVWGTGAMSTELPITADKTTDFRAVRGPLTAKFLRDNGFDIPGIYGDPMSLLPMYHPSVDLHTGIGIVPHYTDVEKVRTMSIPSGCKIIGNINPLEMVDQITSCETIISSSLHGIIVAEAYGVPAIWVEFSDNVAGKGFKFRDYYLGTNREVNPIDFRNSLDIDKINNQIVCSYNQLFANACPFNEEINRWNSDPKTWPDWSSRYKIIGKMIKPFESVIEFGAGGGGLGKYLPDNCIYLPTDKYKRDGIIELDLTKDAIIPGYDVAVFSGVLEYINDIDIIIKNLDDAGIKTVIFSYHPYDNNQVVSWRRANGWISDYPEYELLLKFGKRGYYPIDRREWNGQIIYRVETSD